MRTWLAIAARTGIAALLLGLLTTASLGVSWAADEHEELLQVVDADRYFSPNSDGVSDRSRVVFRLAERAYVSVLVRDRDGRAVARRALGVLPARRHVFRWDGRRSSGRVLPDAAYRVILHATASEQTGRVVTATSLVTEPDHGRLVLSRPVVYPAATAVVDSLSAVYVRADYSEEIRRYWRSYFDRPMGLVARLRITGPDGRRVVDARRFGYRPTFSWSARDQGDRPLSPGEYALRLSITDEAGNHRTILRTVEVSGAQLAPRVWTATLPAALVEQGAPPVYDPGCMDCGAGCGPGASERYPGGLSFQQPCTSFGYFAARYFGASPPFPLGPVDTFRVTATGGPTAPGDTDIAHFDTQIMGPGDATVSTRWQAVDLTGYPYLPEARHPMTWAVSTSDENDYDIASFTLEYRYYAPTG
jgi:hypothetical protein